MIEGQMMAQTPRGRVTAKAPATVAEESTPALKEGRKQGSGHSTSIDIPHYVMDQVREYLAANRDLKFRNLVLLGFTKLGMHVEEDDLRPQRQRGVS